MLRVNIADLKSRLSFYVGRVKNGHEMIVMNRKTPVAKMGPFREAVEEAALVPASKSPSALKRMKIKAVKREIDAVGLLREERDRR